MRLFTVFRFLAVFVLVVCLFKPSYSVTQKFVLIIPPDLDYETAQGRKLGRFLYMAMDDAVLIVSRELVGRHGILLKKIQAVAPREKDAGRIRNFYTRLENEGDSFLSYLLDANNIDMIIWMKVHPGRIELFSFGRNMGTVKREISIDVFDFKNWQEADRLIEDTIKELINQEFSGT